MPVQTVGPRSIAVASGVARPMSGLAEQAYVQCWAAQCGYGQAQTGTGKVA